MVVLNINTGVVLAESCKGYCQYRASRIFGSVSLFYIPKGIFAVMLVPLFSIQPTPLVLFWLQWRGVNPWTPYEKCH